MTDSEGSRCISRLAGLTREIEAAHGQTIQVSQLAALMVALQLHPVDFERELLALHTAIGAYDGLVREAEEAARSSGYPYVAPASVSFQALIAPLAAVKLKEDQSLPARLRDEPDVTDAPVAGAVNQQAEGACRLSPRMSHAPFSFMKVQKRHGCLRSSRSMSTAPATVASVAVAAVQVGVQIAVGPHGSGSMLQNVVQHGGEPFLGASFSPPAMPSFRVYGPRPSPLFLLS
jgi:hypothetical protein